MIDLDSEPYFVAESSTLAGMLQKTGAWERQMARHAACTKERRDSQRMREKAEQVVLVSIQQLTSEEHRLSTRGGDEVALSAPLCV